MEAYNRIMALLEEPEAEIEESLILSKTKDLDSASRFEDVSELPPIDSQFHGVLEQRLAYDASTPSGEDATQAEVASFFSSIANSHLRATERSTLSSSLNDSDLQKRKEHAQVLRAERDLWSLIEILSLSDLLGDVDPDECERQLQSALKELSILTDVPQFVNTAFESDPRLRKGAVLKEWLEQAAVDQVTESPGPLLEPWCHTLSALSQSHYNKRLASMHPDAQLAKRVALCEGEQKTSLEVLPLEGADQHQQEALLKTLWQLLRSGQLSRAQQLAAEHQIFWLAASLQGVAPHFYRPSGDSTLGAEEELLGACRAGNLKQPVWRRSCWKYAKQLSGETANCGGGNQKAASVAGVLELGMYAALSNHVEVLLASPLVRTWQDQLWVLVKAVHERDMSRLLLQYRRSKASHGSLYPGCEKQVVEAEQYLLEQAKPLIDHLSTADCVQIFNRLRLAASPNSEIQPELFLLRLQGAVIEGLSGLGRFLSSSAVQFVVQLEQRQREEETLSSGAAVALRVLTHLLLWLRRGGYEALVPPQLLSAALESYVDHLHCIRQHNLVALFASFLSRPRRVAKYVQTLLTSRAAPSSGSQQSGASVLLALANRHFGADVLDILRDVVVESSRVPPSMPTPVLMLEGGGDSAVRPLGGSNEVESIDGEFPQDGSSTQLLQRLLGPAGSLPPKTPSKGGHPKPRGFGSTKRRTPPAPTPARRTAHSSKREGLTTLEGGADGPALRRMQALLWLCVDTSHRLEAVAHANRLAVSLLLERGGGDGEAPGQMGLVKTLLCDFLPLDSGDVGFQLLQHRKETLKDSIAFQQHQLLISRSLPTGGIPASCAEELRRLNVEERLLQLEEDCWLTSCAKLSLWQGLVAVAEAVNRAKAVFVEFHLTRQQLVGSEALQLSSLGRFRHRVRTSATAATEAILFVLTCGDEGRLETGVLESPATGYKDVWARSERTALATVENLLVRTLATIQNTPGTPSDDAASNKLLQEVEDLQQLATSLFPNPEKDEIGAGSSAVAALMRLTDEDVRHCVGDEGLLLTLRSCLVRVRQQLQDVRDGGQLMGLLLAQLLHSFLSVCEGAMEVLSVLGQRGDAAHWARTGLELANLVATEDYSLQLYTLLHRDELSRIMRRFGDLSLSLLRLEPSALLPGLEQEEGQG